ncbi:MAG: DUF4349 domain-containing protein [Planctomycetes bacterium]|nr:DUF4349 domain-containing protein [Planctomycetota bacterium]
MHSARSRSFLALLVLALLSACTDAEAPAAPGGVEVSRDASSLKSLGYSGGLASGAAPRREREAPRAEDRSLIRRGTLSLQVSSGAEAAQRVTELTRELGGYVSDEQSLLRARAERRVLTLRLPAARLDEALARLEPLAQRVLERRISVEDVSAQVVDLAARLKTLRATETELQELLAGAREAGRGLEDVMAVHRELTSIRTQIEQLVGEERRLSEQVAFATLTVELVLEPEAAALAAPGWDPLRFARRCLSMLLRGLQIVGEIAMIVVLVILPIGALLGFPLWLVLRRRRAAAQGAVGT